MTMSELAFTVTGDTFDVPSTVTAWRVRRLKPRGAPELVYARDGRPLTLPIEADLDDLHEAVTTPGKYRLDPIGDDGKGVENVPAAYIQVAKGERNGGVDHATERVTDPRVDSTVAGLGQAVVEAVRLNAEALRQNAEISMRAVDRLPQLMEAMTTMLNVATGTQLYALQQREVPLALRNAANEGDEHAEADDGEDPPAPAFPFLPGLDINKVVAQVASDVVTRLMDRFNGKPTQASAVTQPTAELQPQMVHPAPKVASTPTADPTSAVPTDPASMAHFLEVKNALTREEQALVAALARDLTPAEQAAWFNALRPLSVANAVASVRSTLAQLAGQQPPQAPTT
jgi:hypothetical protein